MERSRFDRRLKSITDKKLVRDLRNFRKHITSRRQMAKRGVSYSLTTTIRGKPVLEPSDLIQQLHAWCDKHSVDPCLLPA